MRAFVKNGAFQLRVGIVLTLFVAVSCDLEKTNGSYQFGGTSPIDGACSSNEDCLGYPEKTLCGDSAESRVCSCNTEHVKVSTTTGEKTCERVRKAIGQECVNEKQCTLGSPGIYSGCLYDDKDEKRKCLCLEGLSYPNLDMTTCLEIKSELGEPCEQDQECQQGQSGNYSVCAEGRCACHESAVSEGDEKWCRPKANYLGDECVRNAQCRANLGPLAECRLDKCECLEKLGVPNNANTACLAVVNQLEGSCTEPQQCTEGALGLESDCIGNKCSCLPTAVPEFSTNTCHPKRDLVGEECNIQAQCTANIGNLTECNGLGRCSCKLGAVSNLEGIKGSRCIPGGLKISEACLDMAQCPGEPGFTSTCRPFPDRFCGCLTGYTPSVQLDDCLPIRNSIGDSCMEANQCRKGPLGDMSGCFESICNCTEEAINTPEDVLCRRRATIIGDVCTTNAQCEANLEKSSCQGNKCVCLPKTVESTKRDKCLEVKNLNEDCIDINQCSHMEHVECRSKCQCVNGYATHPYVTNTCMKLAMLVGDSCAVDVTQCRNLLEGGAFCNVTTDLCECPADKPVVSLNKTKCLEKVDDLGGTCEESQQCQVEGSLCTGGQCTCNSTSYIEWNGECLPIRYKINDTCQEGIQCSFIGQGSTVQCIVGECQCPEGSRFSELLDRCLNLVGLGQVKTRKLLGKCIWNFFRPN